MKGTDFNAAGTARGRMVVLRPPLKAISTGRCLRSRVKQVAKARMRD